MRSSLWVVSRRFSSFGGLAVALVLFFSTPDAVFSQSDFPRGGVVLEDTISIDHIGRYLYAFDSQGGGRNKLELELRENVEFLQARGRVGLVVTNRRLLAISAGRGGWRSLPLQIAERDRTHEWLSSRIALVVTPRRILGFDAGIGTWVEVGVGPLEDVEQASVSSSTAVVLTGNNAYGLSPDVGGFFVEPLQIHEQIESVSANGTIGRVLTSRRLLIFKSTTGTWTSTERPIH